MPQCCTHTLPICFRSSSVDTPFSCFAPPTGLEQQGLWHAARRSHCGPLCACLACAACVGEVHRPRQNPKPFESVLGWSMRSCAVHSSPVCWWASLQHLIPLIRLATINCFVPERFRVSRYSKDMAGAGAQCVPVGLHRLLCFAPRSGLSPTHSVGTRSQRHSSV